MTPAMFRDLMLPVIDAIAGRPVDNALADHLNAAFPADGDAVRAIEAGCHAAIAAGWMCSQGSAGRRFGRVIEAEEANAGLSVDVVELADIVGPHHKHPNGEICLVMPVDATARFCEKPRGWCVFRPGSAHFPTAAGGRLLVLYLLPGGAIEFTGQAY